MSVTLQAHPGLRDIARELSLSVWTVSKALNGQPGVKEATRQRVLQTARAVGYVPNRQAQILRQKRSRCIGLLLPTLTNPVYSERIQDVYQAAEEQGYEVLVTSYEQDSDRRDRLCRELIGRRVEAVILSGGWTSDILQDFIDARMVVLVIHAAKPSAFGTATLKVAQSEGVRQLLAHLLKLGHRRPLLLGNWLNSSPRMQGIADALRQADLPEDEFLAVNTPNRAEGMTIGYDRIRRLFANNPRAATAVMANNDLLGIGALTALQDLGLSVPGDVSVTGMDDILAARFCRPALTTVSQTHLHLGRRAVEMVIDILNEQSPRDTVQQLMPELVIRQSIGPAKQLSGERSHSCSNDASPRSRP